MKRTNDTLMVIPAYNEEDALEGCVTVLIKECPDVDVLIVNDGSTDGTFDLALTLSDRYPQVSALSLPMNSGIGTTVQTGMVYAERYGYKQAIQYDGDGQHRPEYIKDLLAAVKDKNLDLCVGSRFIDLESDNFKSTWLRRVGIKFFASLISMLSGAKVTDPTSGFRVYGERAISFFSKHYPDDYPEPEALFWCARNGLNVGEVSVVMQERQGGESSIRYLKTAYYMIKVTIAICVDRIRGKEV